MNTASNERNLHEMKKMLVSEKLYPKAKMDELCVAVLSFCLLPGVEYERVRRWASSLALEFAVYGNPSIRILDEMCIRDSIIPWRLGRFAIRASGKAVCWLILPYRGILTLPPAD